MLDSIRRSLNERPLVGGVVGLLVAVAAFYLAIAGSRPANTSGCDYYDEATGDTSKHPITEVPPLVGPRGGPTLVRAYYRKVASGTRELAYLEKYSDAAKAALERHLREHRSGPPSVPDLDRAHLVRLPAPNAPWVPIDSPEGRKVVATQFSGSK